MLACLTELKVPVMLWNIDSQDWNSKIGKERVADRVLTISFKINCTVMEKIYGL